MPVPKKKRTISTPDPSTSEPSSPVLPEQQVFHHYLRTLAQSAVQIVIETVMREELDQFIGAAWGECSPKRKGYRNGHCIVLFPGLHRHCSLFFKDGGFVTNSPTYPPCSSATSATSAMLFRHFRHLSPNVV